MSGDEPTTLDDFRVMPGIGRVILQMAVVSDEALVQFVKVGMTVAQARELASDLIERAELVERERRR